MMKMQAKLLVVLGVVAVAGAGQAQYMAETNAALNMSNTLNNNMPGAPGMPGAPAPVPGMVPGVGAPGAGFQPGAMGGNTMPGMDPMMDPTMQAMDAGMQGGQPQAYQMPQTTPIPTKDVLTGRRVFDAVTGGLLEDSISIAVPEADAAAYPDDGISDNGVAGDGIHGDVQTFKNQYIGPFSNIMKNYLIHAVRNAEDIDPMVYYGYHVAKVEPENLEGMKRYGLPLPGEAEDAVDKVKVVPDMPNVLDLEDDRDELVRLWNHEFLAEYRVTPEDPQSEYYPVFVPSPPLTPMNYPVPNGYVSPQAVAKTTISAADAAAAAATATGGTGTVQNASAMGDGIGLGGMGGGI